MSPTTDRERAGASAQHHNHSTVGYTVSTESRYNIDTYPDTELLAGVSEEGVPLESPRVTSYRVRQARTLGEAGMVGP